MLNSSVKLAAEMVAAEGVESGDDSGKDGSPQRNSGKMQKKKVIAAAAAKKKKVAKKTVFRNNFVKESDSQAQLSGAP